MKKVVLSFIFFVSLVKAHPVTYTIDLEVSYDENLKIAKVQCTSNSKNKCGLYNIKLIDENGKEIADKKFPFLKKSVNLKSDIKPSRMEFYLRKIPEHKYIKIF